MFLTICTKIMTDMMWRGDLIFVTKHKMFLLRLTPLYCTKRALSSLLYPNIDLDFASQKTFFFLFSPLFERRLLCVISDRQPRRTTLTARLSLCALHHHRHHTNIITNIIINIIIIIIKIRPTAAPPLSMIPYLSSLVRESNMFK